ASAPPAANLPPGMTPPTRIQLTSFQPDKDKKDKDGKPVVSSDTVIGPRSPVDAQALPELGAIVIRAQNAADVEAVLQLIKILQERAKIADLQVRLIPLKYADATSVATQLNTLFTRVVVGPSGNT